MQRLVDINLGPMQVTGRDDDNHTVNVECYPVTVVHDEICEMTGFRTRWVTQLLGEGFYRSYETGAA